MCTERDDLARLVALLEHEDGWVRINAAKTLALLGDRDLVRAGGIVYVETARAQSLAPPGLGWDILRDKTLGEVRMVLLQKI